MADFTSNTSNNQTQGSTNAGLAVGKVYIDQYSDRNNPFIGVDRNNDETPVTSKDIDKLISSIENSFANWIDIQRSYIDSDRSSEEMTENEYSDDFLENADNEEIDINSSNNDKISNNEEKNDGNIGLTLRKESDIISLTNKEINNDNSLQKNLNHLNYSFSDTFNPSFDSGKIISDKINEIDDSNNEDKKESDKSSIKYDSISDLSLKNFEELKNLIKNSGISKNDESVKTKIQNEKITFTDDNSRKFEEVKSENPEFKPYQVISSDETNNSSINDKFPKIEPSVQVVVENKTDSSLIDKINGISEYVNGERKTTENSEYDGVIESSTTKGVSDIIKTDEETKSQKTSEKQIEAVESGVISSNSQILTQNISNTVINDKRNTQSEETEKPYYLGSISATETEYSTFKVNSGMQSSETEYSTFKVNSGMQSSEEAENGQYQNNRNIIDSHSVESSNVSNIGHKFSENEQHHENEKNNTDNTTNNKEIISLLEEISRSIKVGSDKMDIGFSELKEMVSNVKSVNSAKEENHSAETVNIANDENNINFGIERIG